MKLISENLFQELSPNKPYLVTDAYLLVRVADIQHAPRISLNPHGIG